MFVFGPLIEHDLIQIEHVWNGHRIRKNSRSDLPHGVPLVMYEFPQNTDGVQSGFPLEPLQVDALKTRFQVELGLNLETIDPFGTRPHESVFMEALARMDIQMIDLSNMGEAFRHLLSLEPEE